MKKRTLISKLTAISMALVLMMITGCGSSTSDTGGDNTDSDTEETTTEASNDSGQEEDSSDDGSGTSGEAHNYLIQTKMRTDNADDEQYTTLYSGSYDMIYMTDEDKTRYPDLWKSLETYNESTESGFLNTYEQYLDEAKDWYKESGPDDYFSAYSDENHIFISRTDDSFLSFEADLFSYVGGAHGSYSRIGYNYDVKTGQKLALKDVITDITRLQEIVITKLKSDYPDAQLTSTYEQAVPQYLTGEEDQECTWYMTPQGIDIYFGVYLIGSYADGAQIAHILYNDNPELFYEGFYVQQGDYVENFDAYENYYTDINEDGKPDELSFEFEYDQNYSIEKMGISLNGNKTTFETYGYNVYPILVHKGGNTYMYAGFSLDNDYYTTYAYRLAEDGVTQIAQYSGRITGMIPDEDYESEWQTTWSKVFATPEDMYLSDRMQLLSTYQGLAKLRISDEGKLMIVDDFYYAQLYAESGKLTALKEVKAATLDPDTRQILSGNEVIPKGKQLVIYGTNNKNYVDLKDDEGQMFRVTLDSSDWPQTIGGENTEELFEGMMFAG